MTAQQDPYVRVYYRIVDDPKFKDVFDHDGRLATWLRLLLLADGTYPAPAPIPFGTNKAALSHLVSVGLVDLEPGSRFRIHGMASERGTRSEKAKAAAEESWRRRRGDARADARAMRPHSDSSAQPEPLAEHGVKHSAPLRSEPIRSAPLRAARDARDDAAWRVTQVVEQLTDRPFTFGPGSPAFDALAGDVAALGDDRVAAEYQALRAESNGSPMDAAQLIFGAHKRLFPIPDAPRKPKPEATGKGGVSAEEAERAFGIVR